MVVVFGWLVVVWWLVAIFEWLVVVWWLFFSSDVEFWVVDGSGWCTCACIWWVLRTMEIFFHFFLVNN